MIEPQNESGSGLHAIADVATKKAAEILVSNGLVRLSWIGDAFWLQVGSGASTAVASLFA